MTQTREQRYNVIATRRKNLIAEGKCRNCGKFRDGTSKSMCKKCMAGLLARQKATDKKNARIGKLIRAADLAACLARIFWGVNKFQTGEN